MWTRKLLKENGKIAFKRNYWLCVAVCVIAMLLGGISGGSLNLGSNDSDTTINFEDNDFDIDHYGAFSDDLYSEIYDEFDEDGLRNILGSLIGGIPSYVWGILGAILMIGAVIGIAMSILVSNVVAVGCNRYFIENREHKTGVGQLFYAFRGGRYGTTVLVMFLKNLYVFLWSLLFVIPGVVKNFAYSLVPYILAENADLDKNRVLKMSQDMMRGHKWELFVLELSFFGWELLNVITVGIVGVFYVNPYVQATLAEFYSAVKTEALQKGIVHPEELPGVSIPVDFVEVV